MHAFMHTHLDLTLCVWAGPVLIQQSGLVGRLVGLQVLTVLLDDGPGPHLIAAPDVNFQDAVEAVPPPERGTVTRTPQTVSD